MDRGGILTDPSKAERITGVVLCALVIVGAIIFAVWARTLFSIFFAAAAVVLITFSLYRLHKLGEEENRRRNYQLIEKINKKMEKFNNDTDDPRNMARWVP